MQRANARLIVRADAGPGIGLGHFVRCAALAQAWQDAGGTTHLVTTTRAEFVPAGLASAFDDITSVAAPHPDPADLESIVRTIESGEGSWVVCDHYQIDAVYTRRLRDAGASVVIIDDHAHQPLYDADVLLNQNLGSDALRYRFAGAPMVLLGPRFALLPRSFQAWRNRSMATLVQSGSLLLMPGGGVRGISASMLASACGDFAMRHLMPASALCGPGTDVAVWRPLNVVSNPEDIPAVMARAEMAVSAAGSSAWQLCFMGIPTLFFTTAANQAGIAACLQEQGCGVNLGWLSELSEADVTDGLERLFADKPARDRISGHGRALVDGLGARRVVARLMGHEVQI